MHPRLADVTTEIDRTLNSIVPSGMTISEASDIGSRLKTARDIITGRTAITALTFTANTNDTKTESEK